jgi:hypothetical protein
LSGNLREVRHEYGLEGNGEGKLKEWLRKLLVFL